MRGGGRITTCFLTVLAVTGTPGCADTLNGSQSIESQKWEYASFNTYAGQGVAPQWITATGYTQGETIRDLVKKLGGNPPYEAFIALANYEGSQGWELIGCTSYIQPLAQECYFKRPVK